MDVKEPHQLTGAHVYPHLGGKTTTLVHALAWNRIPRALTTGPCRSGLKWEL